MIKFNFQQRNHSIFKNFCTASPNIIEPSPCTPPCQELQKRHQAHNLRHPSSVDLITTKQTTLLHGQMMEIVGKNYPSTSIIQTLIFGKSPFLGGIDFSFAMCTIKFSLMTYHLIHSPLHCYVLHLCFVDSMYLLQSKAFTKFS